MLHKNENKNDILEENKDIDKMNLNVMENEIHEKNIENLVIEIKEAENKIKKEIHEKKFIKNYVPRISMPKIKLTPINIQTIQYILSSKTRSQNMLIVLNALLSNMKFVSIATDLHEKEKLIESLSKYLKLEKKTKGSVLFRYGNKGAKLYIILGGEISVLILKETIVELTLLNYIKYLLYLKIIKEDELAKKIIITNQMNSFRLTDKYVEKIYEDILNFINKYYKISSFNERKITKKLSMKKCLKLSSGFIICEKNKNKGEKIDNDKINNPSQLSPIKLKKFKRQSTIDESKSSSVFKKQINKLLNKDNEIEIINRKSTVNKYKEESDIMALNKIEEVENSSSILYKATSKIPNYSELDIESLGPHEISNLVNYVIKNLEKFSRKILKFNNPEEYINLCSVENMLKICDKNSKKEKITTFQYYEITKKMDGDIFGELALQREDNKRTATLIAIKDSVFGYLSKSDYNLCLKGIEIKRRKVDINFIMSFSLFEEDNWLNFEKQYFNYFTKENITNGQVIINQNEKLENIFFIMKGQIEVSTKLSFEELTQILKQKNKRIKLESVDKDKKIEENWENNIQNLENYEDNINNNNNENQNTKNYLKKIDNKLDSKKYMLLSKNQIKQIKEIKNYRLCVVDNKDILGLNDICTDDKISFIKATCISADAIIFSIKINILEQLSKKNRKIKKNIQNATIKREKIMIERLKITINQVKINVKEIKKLDELILKPNKPVKIKRNKRIMSALITQYSEKISLELENTINSNKNETYIIKNSFDKKRQFLRKKPSQKLYINLKRFNINNKNINYYNTEQNLNETISKKEKKTGHEKFLESVNKRVKQINNHIYFSKYSRLFCPIYKKKSRVESEKNNKKGKEKLNVKSKKEIIINKALKTENNQIKDKKFFLNITKKNNENIKINDNNLKCFILEKKKNQILSNLYINNIITKKIQKEKTVSSKFENKTNSYDKIVKAEKTENSEQNHNDYVKKLLGVRFKENITSIGLKTFSKMLVPINHSKIKRKEQIRNKTLDSNIKPIKVDLLFYDKITEKNKFFIKDIILQNQIKQRIISRNVLKNFKTINIDKNIKND